jgi:hypothetical protein
MAGWTIRNDKSTSSGWKIRDDKPADQWQRRMEASEEAAQKSGLPALPMPIPALQEESKWDVPLIPEWKPDLKGDSTAAKVVRGAGKSAGKNVAALTTPKNLTIMGGLGLANVGGVLYPPALPAVQALNATAATYFGAEMASQLPQLNTQYQEKLKRGDVEGATEALTDIGATTLGAAGATRGGVEMLRPTARRVYGGEMAPVEMKPAPLTTPRTERAPLDARTLADDMTPVPGQPTPVLADVLKRRQQQRTEIADLMKESAKADELPPIPPLVENAPFKSAKESAKIFERPDVYAEEVVPPSAREAAATFNQEFGRRQDNRDLRRASVLPEEPTGPTIAEQRRLAEIEQTQAQREALAREMTGKPWEELTNPERVVIDELLPEARRRGAEVPPVPSRREGWSIRESVPEEVNAAPVPRVEPLERSGGGVPPLPRDPRASAALVPEVPAVPPMRESPVGAPKPQAQTARPTPDAPLKEFLQEEAGTIDLSRLADLGRAAMGKPTRSATPGEAYFRGKVNERDAARKSAPQRLKDVISHYTDEFKKRVVDEATEALNVADYVTRMTEGQRRGKKVLTPREEFEYQLDRSLASKQIAENFVEEQGLRKIVQDVIDPDLASEYMAARAVRDEIQRGAGLKVIDVPGGYAIATDAGTLVTGKKVYKVRANAEAALGNYTRKTGRENELGRMEAAIQEFDNKAATRDGRTYKQMFDEAASYSDKLLNYAVESGTIAPEVAAQWRREYAGGHVPMARVFSAVEEAYRGGAGARTGGKHIASIAEQRAFQRRKGSERAIQDPLYALIERTHKAVAEGERNKAAAQIASWAEIPGMEQHVRRVGPGEPAPKHAIRFLENGKEVVLEVSPELEAAAKSLDAVGLGAWGQIIAAPMRLTKTLTTGINPVFVLRNIFRDYFDSAAASKNARKTHFDPKVQAKALREAFLHGESYQELARHGGGYTQIDMLRSDAPSTIRDMRTYRQELGSTPSRAVGKIASTPRSLFRNAEDVSARSEQVGRLRIFEGMKEQYLKEGYSPQDAVRKAVIDANNRMANYRRSGSWGRVMGGLFMYLRAGIAGQRKTMRALTEDPRQAPWVMARIAGTVALPQAMVTAWNLMDPERRKAYGDIEEYEKDNNIIVIPPVPIRDEKGNWEVIKIPLPPGINYFGRMARQVVEHAEKYDKVGFEDMLRNTMGFVNPLGSTPSEMSGSLIPDAIKPQAQALANYDFFTGRPKVPRQLEDLPPAQQAMPYTSGVARAVGEKLNVSPVAAEEFVSDYLGGMAPQIIRAADQVATATGAIKPQPQMGGQSFSERMASSFTRSRGGAYRRKTFEDRKAIRDIVAGSIIKEYESTPQWKSFSAEEQLTLKKAAAQRARNFVSKVEKMKQYQALDDQGKSAMMQQLLGKVKESFAQSAIAKQAAYAPEEVNQ